MRSELWELVGTALLRQQEEYDYRGSAAEGGTGWVLRV